MSYQFPPDIDALVQGQLATGCFASEDEVLRAALEQFTVDENDVRAIQESIDEIERGDQGRPAEEVFAELRARYNVPDNS
jgi:antitoxin ParD1/3/4